MKKYILIFLMLCSCGGSGGSNNNFVLTSEISGLAFPVRLAELPSGKLLIAELATGNLSIYDRISKAKDVIANFPIALEAGIGISGLLVDQDFTQSGFVFVYHGENGSRVNVLTRLTLDPDQVIKSERLVSFAAASGHNGGGMFQFENGNILLGTGDSDNPNSAQNLLSPAGKLILLNKNGQVLNPNYSIGLRNPFGISGTEQNIFVLDNGFNCDDEINLVSENANYGWRADYVCGEVNSIFNNPIFRWPTSEGTTDIIFSQNSTFAGKILAARYNTKTLSVIKFDGLTAIEEQILFSTGEHGQFIDILETRDGAILLASQDGNIYQVISQ